MVKKTKLEIKQKALIDKWLNKKPKKKRLKKKTNKVKTKKEYYKELKSSKWIKRRNEILKKDNYKCVRCGSEKNLQVHHVKYIENRKAWNYPDELLITLCKDCHRITHDLDNKFYKL